MSSRLTAAQIIGLGEYLNPEFDPASLTVSQLLGVLGFHNVKYPSQYTKPKLVQLFNEEIKSKSAKFKKEKLKRENSIASDDGIMDGITGKPIGGEKALPPRRSSRRLSRAPAEEETPATLPEPPKRRRSSAQPNLGGPSRKAPLVQPTLVEESEPEEDVPVRKVGRSKKTSQAAGSQARRVSEAHDDSGWEDNNIFQSGAESSSPVRPPPTRTRAARKSAAPRKSRKAFSAPPVSSPPSSPTRPPDPRHSPPQSRFEPDLPSFVNRELRVPARTNMGIEAVTEVKTLQEPKVEQEDRLAEAEIVNESVTTESLGELEQQLASTSLDSVEEKETAGQLSLTIEATPSKPLWLTVIYYLALLALFSASVSYKIESASVGYCDQDTNSNYALEQVQAKRAAIEACNIDNRTLLYLPSLSGAPQDETPCPPLPPIPLPHANTCAPCPAHATCTQHSVTCDTGFLLRSHALLFFSPAFPNTSESVPFSSSMPTSIMVWKTLSTLMDGLPGFFPVAFPPRCIEDPKRRKGIGALGKAMEAVLAQERGKRLCEGRAREVVKDSKGGEAKRWGLSLEELKEIMEKKATTPQLLASLDDTFNEAVQQLTQFSSLIVQDDVDDRRYLAHHTPNLTWNCSITVKSREIWEEWRSTILATFLFLFGIYSAKSRRASCKVEQKRITELVQIAIDTLRNQELAHYTDPITSPQPYLSSLQLRDLILSDEHSVSTRRRLWDQVERVVEGNANVRANLEEVQGGDELRVWRWVGNAGRKELRSDKSYESGGIVA